MLSFFVWYVLVSLLGLAAFPLAYRLLPALADRGYAFSRMIGLLLWGYLFWLPGTLGVLRNDSGGQVFALGGLLAFSALALRPRKPGDRYLGEILAWLRARRGLVLGMEALFLLAFAGMALVRAAEPALNYTEKPMELAFINAILRSPSLPPPDPWLSGYAISYYYFGYILVAMLARFAGIAGGVAHNLGTALVFGLSALGAYGVVYDLLAATFHGRTVLGSRPLASGEQRSALTGRAALSALLGSLFVLGIGNLEGLLEILHARGWLWRVGAGGELSSGFWTWLDISDLNQPPGGAPSWLPRLFGTGGWWWWRASRVVRDANFQLVPQEVIDEFPAFAFLHADLHPHVLAMPFAFLAMALALNLYLGGGGGGLRLSRRLVWALSRESFLLSALFLGGMFLLNAWDFPIYVALAAGAYALGRGGRPGRCAFQEPGSSPVQETASQAVAEPGLQAIGEPGFREALEPGARAALGPARQAEGEPELQAAQRPAWQAGLDFLSLALGLGIGGILLYLPFYLGFSSQASGILPSLVYFTRGAHLWVMFGALLLPLAAYLVDLWRQAGDWAALKSGLLAALGLALGLWALSLLLAFLLGLLNGDGLASIFGAPDWRSLLSESLRRRLAAPGGWITLSLLLAAALGLLWGGGRAGVRTGLASAQGAGPREDGVGMERSTAPMRLSGPAIFALLLILLGVGLVLFPEFFYLRDLFNTRMNTIFKFYFQAWLLWGVAAAYGTAILLQWLRGAWAAAFRAGLALLLGAALVYPILGVIDKTHGFSPADGLTLDGSAYLGRWAPDELAAIHWLKSAEPGVIVEAVGPGGGSYNSEFARIATTSGLPTVIGWVWHEIQWRGSDELFRDRPGDVERLYVTRDWSQAQDILRRYRIRYVIVGPRERNTYPVYEAKFQQRLTPVFQQGEFVIYEVPRGYDPVK